MEEVSAEGVAYLCFYENSSRFYGTMITLTREQYGLIGQCVDRATGITDVHECCLDESAEVMNITVIDYSNFNNEFLIPDVMKTGGDNCSLISPKINFVTDELLVGKKAEDCIKKFFPPKFQGRDCLVCIGDMKIDTKSDEAVNGAGSLPCCH
ncbi:hypothetical protein SNE40_009064 [Patella caerulea]|uniref:Uncharacterized protein n=1 Tax=Patella caerulea TaxID=87958 RepID=A0AAN8PRG1_PATCE